MDIIYPIIPGTNRRKPPAVTGFREALFMFMRISLFLLLLALPGQDLLAEASENKFKPPVTYRFDSSVPFSQSQKERIADRLRSETATEWDQDGGSCTVYFFGTLEFNKRIDGRASKDAVAFHDSRGGCSLYFLTWRYPTPLVSRFSTDLIHEVFHAWGIRHNKNEKSINYKNSIPGQTLLPSDRFILSLVQKLRGL